MAPWVRTGNWISICPKRKVLEVPKEIVEVGGDDLDDEDGEGGLDKDPDADGGDGEGEPEGKSLIFIFHKAS